MEFFLTANPLKPLSLSLFPSLPLSLSLLPIMPSCFSHLEPTSEENTQH